MDTKTSPVGQKNTLFQARLRVMIQIHGKFPGVSLSLEASSPFTMTTNEGRLMSWMFVLPYLVKTYELISWRGMLFTSHVFVAFAAVYF